jgi:hypothetical protein
MPRIGLKDREEGARVGQEQAFAAIKPQQTGVPVLGAESGCRIRERCADDGQELVRAPQDHGAIVCPRQPATAGVLDRRTHTGSPGRRLRFASACDLVIASGQLIAEGTGPSASTAVRSRCGVRSLSMRFTGYSFGSIRIDGVTYDHDLVIDRGKIRKRKKAASRKFRGAYGHTPLSIDEDIPWRCRRLVVGTGAFLPSLSRGSSSPCPLRGDTAARLVAHSGSEPAGPPTPGPGDRWLPGRVPGGRRALTARTQTFVPLSRPAVKKEVVPSSVELRWRPR